MTTAIFNVGSQEIFLIFFVFIVMIVVVPIVIMLFERLTRRGGRDHDSRKNKR